MRKLSKASCYSDWLGWAHEIAEAGYNPEGRNSGEILDMAEVKVLEIAENATGKMKQNIEFCSGKRFDR